MFIPEINEIFKEVYTEFNFDHIFIKPLRREVQYGIYNYPMMKADLITYGGVGGNAFLLLGTNDIELPFKVEQPETLVRFGLVEDHFLDLDYSEKKDYIRLLITNAHKEFIGKFNPNNELLFGTIYTFNIPGENGLFIRPIRKWEKENLIETGKYEFRIYTDCIKESEIEKYKVRKEE